MHRWFVLILAATLTMGCTVEEKSVPEEDSSTGSPEDAGPAGEAATLAEVRYYLLGDT